MQYVNDMCKCNTYAWSHNRTSRIYWSPTQGSMWFSQSSSWIDWSTCGWNGGAPPSSPNSWGHCKDQLCWHLKSIMTLWISVCNIGVPTLGSQIDHQGSVVFSVLERKWEQLLTTCICHYKVELPGSYECLMIGEDEASSYNAMSVCECTFEYLGIGVQSDAYIWL